MGWELSCTVDDARQLLSAMLDPGTEAGQAMRLALQSTRSPATALRGTRIGVARTYCGYHDELDEVFDAALNRMTQAGAILVDPVAIETHEHLAIQLYIRNLFHNSLDENLQVD